MATINQIRKSIEVAERRLAKANKNAEMYDVRATKAIEKARKATGKEFDRANYETVLCERNEWELKYSIYSNLEYYYENCKNVERETKNIERLRAELANLEKANEPSSLEKTLTEVTEEFRVAWFDKMMTWHGKHFDYIASVSDKARRDYRRAVKMEENLPESFFKWVYYNKVVKSERAYLVNIIKNVRRRASDIMSDKAFGMTRFDYMDWAKETLAETWTKCVAILAKKCQNFGVDETKVKASEPTVTSKGFSVVLTDGKNRVIDARIIWAAEYSVLVSPHTRYIVTERRIK